MYDAHLSSKVGIKFLSFKNGSCVSRVTYYFSLKSYIELDLPSGTNIKNNNVNLYKNGIFKFPYNLHITLFLQDGVFLMQYLYNILIVL